MEVLCINGFKGVLEDGQVYTVREVTTAGNYILEEVGVPEGYTSFSATRFTLLSPPEDWSVDMEEQFWAEQVPEEFNT